MKKILTSMLLIIGSLLIGMSAQASTTVTFSGSEGKMFAPNCFCKEDVKPYKLAPWCEAKNSCNGESNVQSANVADGDYRVKINLGGLTDSQKFEVAIVTIDGKDYTIPDQGGNGSSTGTAVYDLGSLHLSGNVSFKARHKYANTFTGKWYDSEASKIGSGNAMESISVDSIVLQGNTPPPPPPTPPTPTNGSCGTRSISFLATATDWTANTTFCSTGISSPATPAFPAQGGATSWTCNGANGGTNATCRATRAALVPNNAACGTRSASYSAQTTDWPANATFCANGSPTPASPLFPSQGEETKWTCNGTNNGTDVTCKAKREKENEIPKEPEDEDEKDDCKGEIGNYVWLDSDRDGVQDDSEKGISGVRIKLAGDKTDRTTTNSKGRYSFEDLCEGDYVVTVKDEDVDGYTQTFDPDGLKNNKADVELKNDHDSDMSIDFGYAGKKVAPVTGSGNIAIYISILLTLITLITYKKIKARKIAYQK